MNVILGIDIGGSTTKLAGLTPEGKLIHTLQVRASDPVTSAYGGLGRFLRENNLKVTDLSTIVLTGVGASFLPDQMLGVPVARVPEFTAIGRGGLALSGKKEALVVSMGTGTAYVKADADTEVHIGGSGVGGGTIEGLCARLCGVSHFSSIMELAETGDLKNVNLTIADISNAPIETLPDTVTASNFGKWRDNATPGDSALGVLNMVFETIGMLAVFACRNDGIEDVILTGNLTTIPRAKWIFDHIEMLYHIPFTIPPYSVFATAIGAVLAQTGLRQLKED
jgi:type II pantothenate kinase